MGLPSGGRGCCSRGQAIAAAAAVLGTCAFFLLGNRACPRSDNLLKAPLQQPTAAEAPPPAATTAAAADAAATSPSDRQVVAMPRPAVSAKQLRAMVLDIPGSAGHRYGVKDSRGVGMDCMRVVFSPVGPVKRYLAVYHHHDRDTKTYEVYLAQSFNLLHWEFLRRLVNNADMADLAVDEATGCVLLVYEHFLSAKSQWPCSVGMRKYSSVSNLISGTAAATFVAPNTLSQLEGTPSISRWDSSAGTAEIWFHHHNATLNRDEVAQAELSDFPGIPEWNVTQDLGYMATVTRLGATGNVGGRHRIVLPGTGDVMMLQEGNIQPPPILPTKWKDWRVWLYTAHTKTFTKLNVQSHAKSTAFANPSADFMPSPASDRMALFVTYFIFKEGAGKGEGGSVVFYHEI